MAHRALSRLWSRLAAAMSAAWLLAGTGCHLVAEDPASAGGGLSHSTGCHSTGHSVAAAGTAATTNSSGFGIPLNTAFKGMTCFRGNAQRNYYGEGPVPQGVLRVLWRAPIGADRLAPQWNGTGWTGQPLAVQWPDSTRKWMNFHHPPGPATEIIVGGMDSQVHFYE